MQDPLQGNLGGMAAAISLPYSGAGHLLGAFRSETPRPLLCRLKDADLIGAPTMGVVSFPVQKLVEGEVFDGWVDLVDLANKPLKGCAIRATLNFRQDPSLQTDASGCKDSALSFCNRPSVYCKNSIGR